MSLNAFPAVAVPSRGLEKVREDAGGRLVALLRSEILCADPLELNCHELKHVVVEGSAVVAGGASDSCEMFPCTSTFRCGILGLLWILDPTMCARAVRGAPKMC